MLVGLSWGLGAISYLFHRSCAVTDSTTCCFALFLLGYEADHFLKASVCLGVTQKVGQYLRIADPPILDYP